MIDAWKWAFLLAKEHCGPNFSNSEDKVCIWCILKQVVFRGWDIELHWLFLLLWLSNKTGQKRLRIWDREKSRQQHFSSENWADRVRARAAPIANLCTQRDFWHNANISRMWEKLVAMPLSWAVMRWLAPKPLYLSQTVVSSLWIQTSIYRRGMLQQTSLVLPQHQYAPKRT